MQSSGEEGNESTHFNTLFHPSFYSFSADHHQPLLSSTSVTTTIQPQGQGSNAEDPPRSSGPSIPIVRNPKKRTRASRRAPTTVLTTDTSNFRAMVQEFTGIPSPPFTGTSSFSRRFDLFRYPLMHNQNSTTMFQSVLQNPNHNNLQGPANDHSGFATESRNVGVQGQVSNFTLEGILDINGSSSSRGNEGTVDSWICSSDE